MPRETRVRDEVGFSAATITPSQQGISAVGKT